MKIVGDFSWRCGFFPLLSPHRREAQRNQAMKTIPTISAICLFNKTGEDISMFRPIIMDCIKNLSTDLPEEIADIFSLNIITVDDGIRGVLDWA
jgi:hypothetical protein